MRRLIAWRSESRASAPLVKQLEEAYDTEVGTQQGEIGEMNEQDPPRLAPDVEDFLRGLEQRDE